MTNLESKQEAIKKAYGEENYNLFKDEINEDGFIYNRSQFDDYDENDLEYHKMKSFFYENDNVEEVRNMWRPKSLRGLENNNGWIKIESEADLPKEGMHHSILLDSNCINGYRNYDIIVFYEVNSKFRKKEISHYQPIEKKEIPIF